MQFAHNGYYKGSIPFGLNTIILYKKVDDKLDSRSFWVGEPSAFESRLPY